MSERTNKIRGDTLGHFLKGDDNLNHNVAANEAYNPGFLAETDLGNTATLPQGAASDQLGDPEESIRDPRLLPGEALQDLSPMSLKALNEYTEALTGFNENNPVSGKTTTVPPTNRGFPLRSTDGPPRKTYLITANRRLEQLPQDLFVDDSKFQSKDSSSANLNFSTLAGGSSAPEPGLPIERLGSFFGADKLSKLISKTGDDGPTSANYLLKNRAKQIGVEVGEVMGRSNLYSPSESSPYFDPASDSTDLDKGLWSVQTGQAKLGVNPATNPLGTPEGFDKDAPPMTLGALRGLTLKLMLEASGEAGIDNMIDMSESPEMQLLGIIAAMNAAGLSPGAGAQLGMTPLVWDVTRVKDTIGQDDIDGAENDVFKKAFSRLSDSTGADQFIEPGRPKPSTYTVNSLSDFASATFKGPYANLNSWAEPFAGAYPMGMFTASMLGLLSMSILIALIDIYLDTVKKKEIMGRGGDPKNPSTYKMGAWSAKGEDTGRMGSHAAFMRLLGFTEVRSNISFSEAVYSGMKSFYGFDYEYKPLTGGPIEAVAAFFRMLDGAVSIAMSPGYYAVMQRTIFRDVSATASGFESLIGAGIGNAVGVLAAIAKSKSFKALGVHGIIEIIGSSTTFNFMKICTILGDVAYASKNTGNVMYEILDESGTPDLKAKKIQEKIHTLTPGLRIELSRFHSKDGPIRSPLSLMTHNAFLLYQEGLGPKPPIKSGRDVLNVEAWQAGHATDGDGGLMQPLYAAPGTPGRFNSNTVKIYEKRLDTEFTPFYIHDLRTNELISMPAFITSVGESFSPEWNETHGYGRTDPVRTYSKTTRTIDLSFILAAMNPEDMEYMWFVINKLVSMCYPQRSVGRKRTYTQVTGDKGSFIQPFSQVPTASPVVRLRLGELFHSNYSLAGLRRLFGDGTTDFDTKIDDDGDMAYWTKMATVEVSDEAIHEELVAEYEELFHAPGDGTGPPSAVEWTIATAQLIIKKDRPAGGSSPLPVPPLPIPMFAQDDPIESEYPRVDFAPDAAWAQEIGDNPKFRVVDLGNVKQGPSPDDKWYAVLLYFDDSDQARTSLGDHHVLHTLGKDLTTVDAWMRIASVEGLTVASLPSNAVADRRKQKEEEAVASTKKAYDAAQLASQGFFSDKNALVRSFQAASGRGLAGVFTNMTMNYDNATWGTDQGSRDRAPKMVTITLGFAPIHDLPLGLDSHGELISPSHPVGKALTVNPHDLTIVPKPAK